MFKKVDHDIDVDVIVVGAGITGLLAAYRLTSAGRSVAVIERERCAEIDTGHTSAHLTMVTDARLSDLARAFGNDHAQAVWDGGLAAIAEIETISSDEQIDCAFEWVDGYLHASNSEQGDAQRNEFRDEAELAATLGFDATFEEAVPFVGGPGLRFENQARVHPRKFLAGVAKAIRARGGESYEHSSAEEFAADPPRIKVNGHWLHGQDIVIATHNPLVGLTSTANATLFQTKLALYTSYVIAGRVPAGTVPDALFWDTDNPYHYLRIERHRDHDLVIFGGEDHKTGQVSDTGDCYQQLERTLASRVAIRRGLSDYIKENADYPYYLIRDRFAGTDRRSLRSVKRGQGRIIDDHGTTVAAYRNPKGELTQRSATCTHLGCHVGWNQAAHTWDCPCHGSRFTPEGDVISGPAEAPLWPVSRA